MALEGERWSVVMLSGNMARGRMPRKSALAREGSLPVRRSADICALRAPVVRCLGLLALVCTDGKHGFIDRTELLGLDCNLGHGVDFLVAGPYVLQADFAALEDAQHIVFDIEADGARNRIGHDQRRQARKACLA